MATTELMAYICQVKDEGQSKRCLEKPTHRLTLKTGRVIRVCLRHYNAVLEDAIWQRLLGVA